jgi:hypothetical protein
VPRIPHEPKPVRLAPPTSRQLSKPTTVSLDDLVSACHFCRHLEAKPDLYFIREWVQDLYAEWGRPSIDSVVFIKLQVVMLFEGIHAGHLALT